MEQQQAKALATRDQAWTEIATQKERIEAVLERGFQGVSDVVVVKGSLQLVLAEIAYRQAEMENAEIVGSRKMVVGGKYQIAFVDSRQDESTWYNGPATYEGIDDDDYGEEQHFLFCVGEPAEIVSFPSSSVGILLWSGPKEIMKRNKT